jgi:hypothetical protein
LQEFFIVNKLLIDILCRVVKKEKDTKWQLTKERKG